MQTVANTMPNDALLELIGDIREKLGEFGRGILDLETRAQEDREQRHRDHRENQKAMGEMRETTAAALSELRINATTRWEHTTEALSDLGRKLDDHAASVARLQASDQLRAIAHVANDAGLPFSRRKMIVLAMIGFVAVWVMLQLVGTGIQHAFWWAVTKLTT